jgi:ABC-type nitrate/sulfonate/bicarbonate transport system substrate-binding protein
MAYSSRRPGGRFRRLLRVIALVALVAAGVAVIIAGAFRNKLPLRVELGARSISKAPFLIAADQGLFDKYGVDVDLRMPAPDFEAGIEQRGAVRRAFDAVVLRRHLRVDMYSNGVTPDMFEMVNNLERKPRRVLASTDCIVRSKIIGRPGLTTVEELKGKRIGVTGLMHNITTFTALELASRMGWDPVHDFSIILNGDEIEMLLDGRVDAVVAQERDYAEALEKNLPVLLDTRTWGDLPVGGNSLQVEEAWLEHDTNREAARRFLKAMIEATALFHEDRELTLDVLQRWNGVSRSYAEVMYDHSAIPRKLYPCYDGIRRTMEVYDSHAMRAYQPEDFYDDSLLKELDASGFIDDVYAAVKARRQVGTKD